MTLPKDFWEQLHKKTDADLYDMPAHENDYLPEALAGARGELRKRNLTPESSTQPEGVAQIAAPPGTKDELILQVKARSSKYARKRGLRFLIGGVFGGTVL